MGGNFLVMQTQQATEGNFIRSSKLNASRTSSVRGVDHVTYAVAAGMLEKWAWYHIEVEGGHLFARYDDVAPDNPNSSMRLWCIGYESFWIALIEGIDRAKKSQVTVFVEKHGDHSIQHVAYDVGDLGDFLKHASSYGVRLRGNVVQIGDTWQQFTKGHSSGNPVETTFTEYLSRCCDREENLEVQNLASEEAGVILYEQMEDAWEAEDWQPIVEFSAVR